MIRFEAVFAQSTRGDWVLRIGAVGAVGFSLFLPWDAGMNAHRYEPPKLTFSNTAVEPVEIIAIRQSTPFVRDVHTGEIYTAEAQANQPVDPITTGSTQAAEPTHAGKYELLYAADGIALMETKDGFLVASRGARLPDGSIVLLLEETEAGFRLTTNLASYILEKR